MFIFERERVRARESTRAQEQKRGRERERETRNPSKLCAVSAEPNRELNMGLYVGLELTLMT